MDKNSRKYFIITILLLIIILILLFYRKFGKINERYLTPTGNVDVFDININYDCECEECTENEGKNNTISKRKYKKSSDVYKTFVEEEDSHVTGVIFADDDNGDYIYQEHLNIFTNPAYEYTNKIAPGSSNSYYFVVHNSTDTNLKYYVQMYEDSEYKVNLKYRLKRNNHYVIGSDTKWVSAKELLTKLSSIPYGSSDSYILDWKWFDSDKNDTLAGRKMKSEYKLNVRFYFEEDNKL